MGLGCNEFNRKWGVQIDIIVFSCTRYIPAHLSSLLTPSPWLVFFRPPLALPPVAEICAVSKSEGRINYMTEQLVAPDDDHVYIESLNPSTQA